MKYKIASIRSNNIVGIQEKAISLGFTWNNKDATVHEDREPFIYLNTENMKMTWDSDIMGSFFVKHEAYYIPSDVFIMFGLKAKQSFTTPSF